MSDKENIPRRSDSLGNVQDCDGQPPAKRRKTTKPRDMKTEYLDLMRLKGSDSEDHHKLQDAKLNRLMEALRTKRKIVVIAGAGISVSAGSE